MSRVRTLGSWPLPTSPRSDPGVRGRGPHLGGGLLPRPAARLPVHAAQAARHQVPAGHVSHCRHVSRARYLHTADGWTLCGSSGSRFCLVLAGGRWAWSRQLGSKRAGHASWRVPGGVLLLGGWGSPRTTDLLTDGGTVQRNPFLLKYPIK